MYGEKANSAPPAIDGQNRAVSRTQTRYIAHPANAGAAIISRFTETRAPKRDVTGSISSAGPGKVVTHARSRPCGA